MTEEGLLLTIRDRSTGRNMEAENTANNILASVKEQVARADRWNPSAITMFLLLWWQVLQKHSKFMTIFFHFYQTHRSKMWPKHKPENCSCS